MIRKIILFGDFKTQDSRLFKSAAVLRLSYALRKKGYIVKQVHHCTNFSYEELKQIIVNFADGEKVCVGVSTSFLTEKDRKFEKFNKQSPTATGKVWGNKSFSFLLNVGKICKELDIPYLLGGWEIKEKRLTETSDPWGYNVLSNVVTYFVEGKDTESIENVCQGNNIEYKIVGRNKKLIKSTGVIDYSDCASTPTLEDHIAIGESLTTEVAAGCIFSCSFCNYAALGKKKNEYTRSYESFEAEIKENYNNFKTTLYTLTDNIVNDTTEKIRYLIDVREKTGIDFKWAGYVRLDTIQSIEQAKLLKESGMVGASFGIESLYKNSGRYIGKVTDRNKIMKSLEIMRSVFEDDAIFTGLFIAGLPEEPIDHMVQTFEWLNSIEGRYFLDSFSYTAFKLFPNNAEKNKINISRNNPFRDYVFTDREQIKWISPWSDFDEVLKLTRDFSRKRKNKTGVAFSLSYLVNTGVNLEQIIKDIRETGKSGDVFSYDITDNIDKFIKEYKRKLLNMPM